MCDHANVEPLQSPGLSLLGSYIRTALWYMGLVAIVWVIGLEGIHGHPFPFYALISPVFTGPTAPLTLLGILLILLGALLRWLNRPAFAFFGSGLFALVVAGVLVVFGPAQEELMSELAAIPWYLLAIAVFVGFLALIEHSAARLGAGAPQFPRRWTLLVLVAFAALFPICVAMLRGGPDAIATAYNRQSYEYISDIGAGGSIRGLFADYAELHPYLSMHAKVHPPGPIAILWLLSYVAGRTPMGLSIATILFGAISVIPLFYWARDVFDERTAYIAASLYVFVPTIVLFTATSADITFMPFTIATLFCFWRALHRRSIIYAIAAGVLYGILGLISYSLLSIGAFFAVIGLWRVTKPETGWAVIQTAAIMITSAIAVHYAVYLWSGYNSIEVFQLAKAQFDTDQANLDQLDPRLPSWAWKIANPICWFFFAGIPVSLLCLWRLWYAPPGARVFPWLMVLTLLVLDFLYLARGEGERSAMYIVPFVVLPAAAMLGDLVDTARSWQPLIVTLGFLGVQSIAIESILFTYW